MRKQIEALIAKAEAADGKTATAYYGQRTPIAAIQIAMPGSARYAKIDSKKKSGAPVALAYMRIEHYTHLRSGDPLSMTGTVLQARDDQDIKAKNIAIIADENGAYAMDHLMRKDGPAVAALKAAALL